MLNILYAGSPACAAKTLSLLLEKNAVRLDGAQSQNAASSNESGGQGQNAGGRNNDSLQSKNAVGKQRLWKIAGVLTNPPSARGRSKALVPTDVAALAEQKGIAVFCPQKLDAAAREQIAALQCDALVCFAYGKIFGPKFLSLFKLGGVNVHPSLLPKYRGATPVPAAILNGDRETGVTVQTLALGMDEGDILAQEKIALDLSETADGLLEKSAAVAADLLDGLLQKTAEANAFPQGRPQEGDASYTKMILKNDALIQWNDSARKIAAAVRAYRSEPGAWTRIGGEGGETLKILKAFPLDENDAPELKSAASSAAPFGFASASGAQGQKAAPVVRQSVPAGTVAAFDKKRGILVQCGDGVLCVTELQRQQKKAMGYKDFMNGARDFVGARLG